MRIDHLSYFAAVVEYGTISKASGVLYISPQGLSQALQKLEAEVGVPLFYREGSRMELTSAGEEMYVYAKEILSVYDEMNSRMSLHQRMTSSAPSELHIVSSPAASATFLPRVLNQMYRKNAGLRIDVNEGIPEQMLAELVARPSSVIIICTPEPDLEQMLKDSPQALNYHEVYRCQVKACVSMKSPLAKRPYISIDEFCSRSIALFGKDGSTLAHLIPDPGVQDIILSTGSMQMCRSMISFNENCIGFTNDIADAYLRDSSLASVPLQSSLNMLYGVLISPENIQNPLVEQLIQLIRAELKNIS